MQLFETIAMDILSGQYQPGHALPPERVLSQQLGVGRPALREALRRLESFGLVESRHGSGTRVLDWRNTGTVELLPYYLAAGAPGADASRIVRELLRLRIQRCCDVVELAIKYGNDEAFAKAGQLVAETWAQREDPVAFALADFEVYRSLAQAADFPPAIWLLNTALEPYRLFLERFPGMVNVPPNYKDAMEALMTSIRARNLDAAMSTLTRYLEDLDAALLEQLGISRTGHDRQAVDDGGDPTSAGVPRNLDLGQKL